MHCGEPSSMMGGGPACFRARQPAKLCADSRMTVPASAKPISSVVIVGGPDSGKSNYIFRLWLAINDANGAICADGLPDHLDYLQTGSQSLLRGEFAQKTPHDVF